MAGAKNRRSPVAERLISELEQRIRNGEFPVHSLLPSIRMLAAEYSASPRTVEAALRQMCERDLLIREPGRGFWVPEMRSGEVRRIAVLHQEHGIRDPRPQITAAIGRRLSAYGYQWDAVDLKIRKPDVGELKKNYAGVVFSRQLHDESYMRQIAGADILRVTAGRETDLNEPASYVDRRKWICGVVRMLYAMGHRNVSLIVRSETDYFYPRMIEAYYEVLADSGMSGNRNALVVMSQNFELGAYLACRDLLKGECRPTAIIASRDYQACGVYQACMAQNLLPGRDISIISYDDIGWSAGREILTTYSEPCEELGAAAVDILHDMLSGNGGSRHREAVPVLQMRRTLAPIPLDQA
ncbi:MAG: GntR family transcriptional regulator [Lentisphaeria bacterium]|nr:GntR family transcriptional regulator [Lentisphaeria bacterium]